MMHRFHQAAQAQKEIGRQGGAAATPGKTGKGPASQALHDQSLPAGPQLEPGDA